MVIVQWIDSKTNRVQSNNNDNNEVLFINKSPTIMENYNTKKTKWKVTELVQLSVIKINNRCHEYIFNL